MMATPASLRPCGGRLLKASRMPSLRPVASRRGVCSTAWETRPTTRPATAPGSRPGAAAPFSTTSILLKRGRYKTRDASKHRGESSLYGSGPKEFLSVSNSPLPRPRDPADVPAPATDPDHGLWGFFRPDKALLSPPEDDTAHGRAWTVEELRRKSWEDLHCLWYACVRERNRISTEYMSRAKHDIGFGNDEAEARDEVVRTTMKAIKHTLTERFYAWEDAVELAKDDPEVDLSGEGPAFTPREYLEEEGEGAADEGGSQALSEADIDPSTLPSTTNPTTREPRA